MLKKIIPFLSIILLLASCVVDNTGNTGYARPVYGTIIAVAISWTRNKSVLWAIIHGLLGWLYVIYALIVGKK
jgi:hypothetical protein